jgi:HSP20 family protein
MGIGGEPVEVQPFGNVKFDKKAKHAVVQEVREPLVDVIEEAKRILVIAEMPGVTSSDISVHVDSDVMTIDAHRGNKKYRKEVLLPKPVKDTGLKISCNNGMVQIECPLG